jgi:hypothetical protein
MNCEWNMHLCYPRKLVRRVAEFMIGASKTSSGYREKKKNQGKAMIKLKVKINLREHVLPIIRQFV